MMRSIGVICVLLAAASLAWQASVAFDRWEKTRAYEQEWVARSLAQGHGFSFPAGNAWLGPYENASGFSPTAWVDPIQPLLIAGCYRVLGDYAHFALLALNFVWAVAKCWVAYALGRRLVGTAAGVAAMLAVAWLPTWVPSVARSLGSYVGNTALAALLFVLCALLLIRCIEHPTLRRGLALGGLLGVTALTHASSMFFAPISALAVIWGARSQQAAARQSALAALLTSFVVVAPWIFWNSLRFETFVPLRTGGGFQLHIGNVALARQLGVGFGVSSTPGPAARSGLSVWSAVEKLQSLDGSRELRDDSHALVIATAPANYSELNEAQRDRLYLQQTKAFVIAEPVIAVKMAVAKAVAFFFTGWDRRLGFVSALAIIGLIALRGDRRIHALAALIASYAGPAIISAPFYYRYRAPIEPLLVVLAGAAAGVALRRWGRSAFAIGKTRIES